MCKFKKSWAKTLSEGKIPLCVSKDGVPYVDPEYLKWKNHVRYLKFEAKVLRILRERLEEIEFEKITKGKL